MVAQQGVYALSCLADGLGAHDEQVLLDLAELFGAIAQLLAHALALTNQLPALLQLLLEFDVALALELQLLVLLSQRLHDSHVLCFHARDDVVLVVELLLDARDLVRVRERVARRDYLLEYVAQAHALV